METHKSKKYNHEIKPLSQQGLHYDQIKVSAAIEVFGGINNISLKHCKLWCKLGVPFRNSIHLLLLLMLLPDYNECVESCLKAKASHFSLLVNVVDCVV